MSLVASDDWRRVACTIAWALRRAITRILGLGETMMATALVRMFEDDFGFETRIVCPKNLEPMWERYRTEYGLRGMVPPISQVTKKLAELRRYRLVLIDESHNLRNREGRRYKAIADYIRSCDAKVILLTATPYNKTKADLSSQLRLFIDEKANIGIRPEHFMRKQDVTEAEFERKHQCKVWDPRPAWPDKKNRPCRHAERKTVLMRLAEAGVSPHAPVYLVCIEQELECWLLANERAISALLSTPAHPYSGSKVQVPDSVVQPKSEMLKHFKKARGWRYVSPRMRAHKERACNTIALHCNTLSDRSPSCPPH